MGGKLILPESWRRIHRAGSMGRKSRRKRIVFTAFHQDAVGGVFFLGERGRGGEKAFQERGTA